MFALDQKLMISQIKYMYKTSKTPLEPNYDPKKWEGKIYKKWRENGVGIPEIQEKHQKIDPETAESYCILMPPPNLTGSLHSGHAFQHYLMDSLSRVARQKGKRTLWYPGVDHAGIQLEGVIDKLINNGEFDEQIGSQIPSTVEKSERASYLKKVNRDLWLSLAWEKVKLWKSNQETQSAILGDTPDYHRSLFTLDPKATQMVMHSFIEYWKDGLVYQGEYLINWSVGLQTALSDFQQDVEWVERKDPFITFFYELEEVIFEQDFEPEIKNEIELNLKKIFVSTVRPETIFGDVAIAIHPTKLEEYLKNSPQKNTIFNLIKQNQIKLIYGIKSLGVKDIKLIPSEKVDLTFGSGALKITPAHDQVDYDLYQEFYSSGLLSKSFKPAIARSGKLTEICGDLEGLTVDVARLLTIKRLIEGGNVPQKAEIKNENKTEINVETQINEESIKSKNYYDQIRVFSTIYQDYEVNWEYTHNVLYCERSKTPIEPLISTEYFLSYSAKSLSLSKSLQQIGLEGVNKTEFYPAELKDRAINILENIHDWCISRSLVWGHQIPVWYNEELNPTHKFYNFDQIDDLIAVTQNGKEIKVKVSDLIHVGIEAPAINGKWVREEKVFDTWFSSCLWPLTTLDFFDTIHGRTGGDFEKYYPSQVMVTGIDIFYAWILRMIILCTYWTGQTPFEDLVINPTILDEKGKKMSKSLGNGLDAVEAINKFSSDALRLSMLSGMIPGRNFKLGGSNTDKINEKSRNLGNKIWNIARFLQTKQIEKETNTKLN